jgi:hypothetical protein
MDRLVIESALSDVNEILLSGSEGQNTGYFSIVLVFKPANTVQALHAFIGLKDIVCDNEVSLVICKSLLAGIYDLEIKTEGLDEPIRIMNKAIDNETLGAIEDKVNNRQKMVLSTNASEDENVIVITEVLIKACNEVV